MSLVRDLVGKRGSVDVCVAVSLTRDSQLVWQGGGGNHREGRGRAVTPS